MIIEHQGLLSPQQGCEVPARMPARKNFILAGHPVGRGSLTKVDSYKQHARVRANHAFSETLDHFKVG